MTSITGTAHAADSLDPTGFILQRNVDNPTFAGLSAALPRATVKQVLDSANRTADRIENGSGLARNFAAGFDLQRGDNDTQEWWPQGVTTSSDAYDDGLYEGRKVVLVSWYDKQTTPAKGVRVSFVDRTDPLHPVYRHVLLVAPATRNGKPDYGQVNVHAGGMFWYGNLLYVVDTGNGLRVFDLDHLLEVSTADDTKFGRAANGTYSAYGYRYVLPQRFTYKTADNKDLRFSFVSLDRTTTPDSVLIGEYDADGDGTRLVRWNIDHTDRELVATGAKAAASWAYQVDIRSMQGVNSVRGKYFISRSNGRGSRGDLITWKPGQTATVHAGALPTGPEDLAYRKSTDEMWTVSEYPGNRHVFSVTAGKF